MVAQFDTNGSSRRRFLRYLLGFSVISTGGMIAWPIIRYLVPPPASGGTSGGKVSVGSTTDLPIGSAKVVPVAGKPAIVVNTDQGIKAYSAICTHLGCIVVWDDTAQVIVCPCHDGRFSPANGSVISGPPPAPLSTLDATVEDDTIYVVVS